MIFCALALQARAITYYVVVAGLGGEPDYEQRFTSDANDLNRIFNGDGLSAHVTSYRRAVHGSAVAPGDGRRRARR